MFICNWGKKLKNLPQQIFKVLIRITIKEMAPKAKNWVKKRLKKKT